MDLKNESIKRILIPFLLPNFLVWGFWVQGINDDRHFLWQILIGPYWHFELLLFGILGFGALMFACWKMWFRISQSSESCEPILEKRSLGDDATQKYLLHVRAQATEAHQELLMVPAGECNKILKNESCLSIEGSSQVPGDQEAPINAETEAKAKAVTLSPEAKKARALSDLTGGGL